MYKLFSVPHLTTDSMFDATQTIKQKSLSKDRAYKEYTNAANLGLQIVLTKNDDT